MPKDLKSCNSRDIRTFNSCTIAIISSQNNLTDSCDISVSPQVVATMLQRLEKAGLIVRRGPLRGRSVQSYLTASSEALLLEGDRVASEIEAQLLSNFSSEEQELFNDYLQRCSANLKFN